LLDKAWDVTLFHQEDRRRRILLTLNMNKVVRHLWEASEAAVLDRDERVAAWAKNEHLGFEIAYVFDGEVRKYRPDYLVRMTQGTLLVLEVKGRESARDQTKRRFMDEWVRAVNDTEGHGGFGAWAWAVSRNPSDVHDVLSECLTGK
jgi:type III restriction enzyme